MLEILSNYPHTHAKTLYSHVKDVQTLLPLKTKDCIYMKSDVLLPSTVELRESNRSSDSSSFFLFLHFTKEN